MMFAVSRGSSQLLVRMFQQDFPLLGQFPLDEPQISQPVTDLAGLLDVLDRYLERGSGAL
jgi:hypothetical protein